ncbi:MAG: dihydrolipoyl dehydrogenase [Rubrivivax sp.]
MATTEVKVPDIGDFDQVSVIEVLVKEGDTIAVEQSLITVESDKASMEIPSSVAGVVKQLKVKIGDSVSEGSVLMTVEVDAAAAAASAPPETAPKASAPPASESKSKSDAPSPSPSPSQSASTSPSPSPSSSPSSSPSTAPAPVADSYAGSADQQCQLLVLGAGPGGYSAAFRAADLGLTTILVERFPTLGGVCLNVGCIPSKALLHVAAVMDEAAHFADLGVDFGTPKVDLQKLLAHKNKVVGRLTGGLAQMAKMRKVTVVTGDGTFIDPHYLQVRGADGKTQTIKFEQAIIAAGSEAIKLPFLPDDERIVTSTGALELRQHPERMLVIGGGIIGLEMGTVYSTLGAKLDVVEMLDTLMTGADRDLVKVWQKMNAKRFDQLMLKTKTVGGEAKKDGIHVTFEGLDGKKSEGVYDLVLQAVGRTPNGKRIGADKAGVTVGERGFIPVDQQMRTNVPHIFAIGDIVGQPMLAHKAVHEAHVAAEVAAGDDKALFDARVIPSVAYTDPEVAWVGLTEDEASAQGIAVKKGLFPWSASGRAIANGRDEGFTKLLFDARPDGGHRVLGGGIVGTHAGDMIGEVALAIEMGADAVDIGKTIHPHPTLGESIGMAAEVAHGSCTDLPPVKR